MLFRLQSAVILSLDFDLNSSLLKRCLLYEYGYIDSEWLKIAQVVNSGPGVETQVFQTGILTTTHSAPWPFAIVVSVPTIGNRTIVLGSKGHWPELSGGNFEIEIHAYYQKEFLNAHFFSGHRSRPANW